MTYSEVDFTELGRYLRSDLALECGDPDTSILRRELFGFSEERVDIRERQGGLSAGRYATLTIGPVTVMGREELEAASCALCESISSFISGEVREAIVIGLGNRDVTPDALGPFVVRNLNVTRHLKRENKALFRSLGGHSLSALAPGVTGQTGIETLELVRGAITGAEPELAVIVDALASRSTERLCRTMQITNGGISPGSGVGNKRLEFSSETLGVPVIAIGVPTVIDSSAMISEALETAGVRNISSKLESMLEGGRSFFVTTKDADAEISLLAGIISASLNRLFSVEL